MVKSVSVAEFDSHVKNSDVPVLVDFWAEWCGPCRMLTPILEEISDERDDIKIAKINVDEEGLLAQEYGVSGIPALFIFKDGEIVANKTGLMKKNDLNKWIDEVLKG